MNGVIPKKPLFTAGDLKRLIVPLIIEQVLVVLVGMTDVMMVSFAGEAAVSGVSLVDMINQLLIGVFSALATGGAVVASQLLGAREPDRACRAARQLVFVVALISLGIMVFALLSCTPLLRLLFGSIEDDVMRNAQIYFILSALSYPFLALYNAGAALFRAQGNSRISMYIAVLSNLINLAGDAITIYGLHMGAAGAALASLAARAVSAVMILMILRNPKNTISTAAIEKFRPDKGLIGRILGIGVPNGIENSMFQLGRVLVVGIIATFGTTQIAANAIANNFDALGCLPGQAISLAIVTVIGQCVGAHDYGQARYYTFKLMKLTYIITAVLNVVILATLPLTIQLYHLTPETTRLAMILILIHDGFSIFIWPLSFALPNVLRAANDVRYAMTVSVLSMWIFRCVLAYVLGARFGLGAIGVWIAMIADWVFRSSMFLLRYRRGKWMRRAIGGPPPSKF